jgi:hypothetical protein
VTTRPIDLRVGGDYHFVFVTPGCSFPDQAGRDHMTGTDGLAANDDNGEELVRSLLDPKETVAG